MEMTNRVSYGEAVQLLRADPEAADLVKVSYLDADPRIAWHRFETSEEWEAVKGLLKLDTVNGKKRVVDLGCGNGIASVAFSRAGHEVFAVDPDGDCSVGCGAINQYAETALSVIRAFGETLPFPSRSFDVVYGRQVLHHLHSLTGGLTECARIVRRNGKILFCREHVIDDDKSLSDFLDHHPLHRYHGGENAYPLGVYLKAFQDAGLRLVRVLGPFDSAINHFPTSNAEVHSWFTAALTKCFGATISNQLSKFQWLEDLYRQRISRRLRNPGRLYSFLAEVV